jgi:hypothetical protein
MRPERIVAAIASPQPRHQLRVAVPRTRLARSSRVRPRRHRRSRRRRGPGRHGLVPSRRLLGDELSEDRARLRQIDRRRRLGPIAQRLAAPAEPEVHHVLRGRDLDEVDLVHLVRRALAKSEARLFDHPHRASLQRRGDRQVARRPFPSVPHQR